MKNLFNTWSLTIKNRMILSSSLLVLIIALSNLYSYYSNSKVIAQQDQLNGQRLQVLLQLATIGNYVALAELESRSYLLIEKEEFNTLRRGIWEDKINPAAAVLKSKLEEDQANINQKEVAQLLANLITYQQLQEQTEIKIRSLLTAVQKQDSASRSENKDRKADMALEINQYQRPVFDAIKEGSAKLIQQQRELIHTESDTLSDRMRIAQFIILGLIVGSLVASLLLVHSLVKVTINPLLKVSDYLSEVALGKQPAHMEEPKNEMGIIIGSINRLVTHLKASANFASQVGAGKYDNQLIPASGDDTLGNALLIMQERLQEVESDGKKRNWVAEGIAKFATLLRDHTIDKRALGIELVSFLVRYLKANQGGLFILRGDSENRYLELEACYAYERKKFIQKTIHLGEGLVGQAVLEAGTIYLTKVPEDYVQITSGLGEAPPSSILIVPLKLNEQVYGAIEIASFNPFALHEIAFLEKLAESAASAIAASQLHEQTQKLLMESQQKAEELRAQEEEMRQNMEELQATQEAEARRIKELEQINVQSNEQQQLLVNNMEKLRMQENEILRQQAEIERTSQLCGYYEQENHKLTSKLEASGKELI
ncbi:GAF domain-containing protein [Chryseolinea soli]|uniref:GAF domain-containing protein n=1 Tax=Chryseolinea soli TaxID=2321403 RepID=A0A385SNI1_9BACT|nr:GAF domain-containing protein [Chryseolinea soli]AYB32066.1 GAF domain-containing protein [Chryseolinea soli]